VCIAPPVVPSEFSMPQRNEFVIFDAYMFLIKMARSMALTFPQFSAPLRVLGEDVKRLFGALCNTPHYDTVRKRKDYIILKVDNLDVTPVEASWRCECAEVLPEADPVANFSAVSSSYIQYDPSVGRDNKHGQMKLITVEMRFLNHVLLNKTAFDTVIYLGGSPGDHIGYLMKMFPAVRWYAYDLKPIIPWDDLDIIPNDEIKFARLKPMFDSTPRKKAVIINDIFSDSPAELYKINEAYYNDIEQYVDIVYYMEKCFVDYKKPLTRMRIKSDIWFQAFQNAASGEVRQVFRNRLGLESVSTGGCENRVTMFRQEIRPKVWTNGRCYDCHYTDLILKCGQAVSGVDMTKNVWFVKERKVHPPIIWKALQRLRTKKRMKDSQGKGIFISKKKYNYHYVETDNYDVLSLGGKVIRMSKDIPPGRNILKDFDPPEILQVEAKTIVVNEDFVIKVPPYVLSRDDFLEVQINGRYECLPAMATPFCINCNTLGAAFGPRLDLFGSLSLDCGCRFVKTGIVRTEFVAYTPPDSWDDLGSFFSMWE